MYESVKYQDILERMLARVPDNMDKREGSIIMTALAPVAAEVHLAYQEIDRIMDEGYADTQTRDFLVRRAAERGIFAKPATNARRRAQFNKDVPLRSRFTIGGVFFTVAEKLEDGGYCVICDTAGALGNITGGEMVAVDYIESLTSALLGDIIVSGQDEEDTEALRRRYFESIDAQAFGGNVADYREKAIAQAGVGGAKVLPLWDGPGTVKLLLISANFSTPSAELVAQVQETMDPISQTGQGLGLAPIGHKCTVVGVTGAVIQIGTTVTIKATYDEAAVCNGLKAATDGYFKELAATWTGTQRLIVRTSQLDTRLLAVPGVLDVETTTINTTAGNLTLQPEQIPIRGQFDAQFT